MRVIEKARESAGNVHKNNTLEVCAGGTGSYNQRVMVINLVDSDLIVMMLYVYICK